MLTIRILIFIIFLPAWIMCWSIRVTGISIIEKKFDFDLEFWPFVFNLQFLER
jgi:hypothetical protein